MINLIFLTVFFFLNIKIVFGDIREKKIRNSDLGKLFLVGIVRQLSLAINGFGDPTGVIVQFIGSVFIGFLLFYFSIWSAGDAKYVSVLCLFLFPESVITLVGNIALLTLVIIIIQFIFFYIQTLCVSKFRKGLTTNIINDIKERILGRLKNSDGGFYKKEMVKKGIKILINFFIFFISLRLSKLYFDDYIYAERGEEILSQIITIFRQYSIVSFLLSIGVTFGLMYVYKYISNQIKKIIVSIVNSKMFRGSKKVSDSIEYIYISIMLCIIVGFIFYEYSLNSDDIIQKIHLIFTLYIVIFIIFRTLWYMIKVSFQISEDTYIKIETLKVGDIIDKPYLINLLGQQQEHIEKIKKYEDFDIKKYLFSIDLSIEKKDIQTLQNVIRSINNYHKKRNTPGFNPFIYIKISRSFAFSPYLFGGFIITQIWGTTIYDLLLSKIIHSISMLKELFI